MSARLVHSAAGLLGPATMSAKEQRAIALRAARTRWSNKKKLAAWPIERNRAAVALVPKKS